MNSFGHIFRLTTFGESHGAGIGAVVDGCPSGVPFDTDLLRLNLARRRPGQTLTSARDESDEPEVLSGIYDGVTTGAPIAVLVRNTDQRSKDYNALKDLYRPSHADYTYAAKYGVRDHRGGGRASARETLARVIGGSIAQMYLRTRLNIAVKAAVTSLGPVRSSRSVGEMSIGNIYDSPVRCDDPEAEHAMTEYIEKLRAEGDSGGGIVSVHIEGVPVGIGEPIYDKLNARIAYAMMTINGALGIEFGSGFGGAASNGSVNNDAFIETEEGLKTLTNNSGGIQGGISNGMPIEFRVAFKPPSSIAKPQQHGTSSGETTEHTVTGRHDPTIVVRAVPVVEAMAWLVLADGALSTSTKNQSKSSV